MLTKDSEPEIQEEQLDPLSLALDKLSRFEVDGTTVSILLSKFIGYAIVLLSPSVRLIQIMKCFNGASALGISFMSIYMDGITYNVGIGYNLHFGYPFSTWGENFALYIGTIVLLGQIWYYEGSHKKVGGINLMTALGAVMALNIVLFGYYLNIFPLVIYEGAFVAQTMFFISSRLTQLTSTYKAKSTGSLALVPYLLCIAGNVARIYTILVEVPDWMVLMNIIIAFVLNSIVLFMFWLYWNNSIVEEDKKEK